MSDTTSFTLTVTPVNDAPLVEQALNNYSRSEDFTDFEVDISGVFADIESDPLIYSLDFEADFISLELNGTVLSFSSIENQHGVSVATLTADDQLGLTTSITFNVSVSPVNDLPVVLPQELSFLEDDTLSITLTGEDVESDVIIFTILDQPTHGTLSDNSSETIDILHDGHVEIFSTMENLYYVPDSNYYGTDSFTFAAYDEYSIVDTSLGSPCPIGPCYGESETISLTIASVNDAPKVTTPDVYALENTETEVFLTGEIGGGQLEADETLAYYLVSIPSEGTVSVVSYGDPIESSQLPLMLPEPMIYLQYSHTFVSDSISYYIKDNGGTDNGGQDTSEETTLPIYLQIVPFFEYQTEGPIEGGISKLDSASIYVTASGDGIYRFDDAGNKLYKLDVAGEVKSVTTITPAHNVYIGSTDNNLYSFGSAGVSNPNWPLALGSEATASVAVDQNENIYIGTHNGIFQALSSDKQILWSYNAGAAVYCSAAITVNNDLIFTNENGMLYCFDLDEINTATPGPIWYYPIGEGVVSSIALDGNYIYATTLDGSLIKLEYDPSNSSPTEEWSFQADTVITSSPIIGSQHEIYFGTQLGTIYSINSADGTVIWSYNTGSSINSTGALAEYGSDLDRLFIGNDDGDVYALSIADGHPYWIYGSGSSIKSAFLYDDGVVHFGTEDGRILKIADNEALSAGLAKSSAEMISIWGTFQGDNNRTGNRAVYIDNIAPTVIINTTVTSPTDTLIIPLTVTFSESVIGFVSDDITIGNGTLSSFAGYDGIYTFDITPIEQGEVTVDIASGVCNDLAGNANVEANQLVISYLETSIYSLLIPDEFALKHSYPNPFNPVTNIRYELPEIASVTLIIYDMTGRETVTLYNGTQAPGYHNIVWDASNHASGIYFIKMVAGDYISTQKLVLVK
ncbi:T9SS C-terminal target domain-containing protein [Candidatus Marinimicrobia bacterium PRS2]|nr:T9SS C-terminal target domain-containing protein [Candidatus Marinimicrobia bacterium PRS2]